MTTRSAIRSFNSGDDNLAPFYLQSTETMLKHKKVSDILLGTVEPD